MIYVYGLSYKVPKYLNESLWSIIDTASEPVCITVVDSKSEKSAEMFEVVKPLIDKGLVKRYIQLSSNAMIMSMYQAYEMFPPKEDSEEFFIMTELDVKCGFDWISEHRRMRKSGYKLCGFKLSLENYVPPNGGYVQDGTSSGYWLMGIDKYIFDWFRPQKRALSDHEMRGMFLSHGHPMKQSHEELYHYGWDIWKDDAEYWKRKSKGVKWNLLKYSGVDFVYELPE